MVHTCDPMRDLQSEERRLRESTDWEELPALLHGPAITRIARDDGRWWAHNEEYSSVIRYCPYCGEYLEALRP